MVDTGATLNSVDRDGFTPLTKAAYDGRDKIVVIAVRAGMLRNLRRLSSSSLSVLCLVIFSSLISSWFCRHSVASHITVSLDEMVCPPGASDKLPSDVLRSADEWTFSECFLFEERTSISRIVTAIALCTSAVATDSSTTVHGLF